MLIAFQTYVANDPAAFAEDDIVPDEQATIVEVNRMNIAGAAVWLRDRWVENAVFRGLPVPSDEDIAWLRTLMTTPPPTEYITLEVWQSHGYFEYANIQ